MDLSLLQRAAELGNAEALATSQVDLSTNHGIWVLFADYNLVVESANIPDSSCPKRAKPHKDDGLNIGRCISVGIPRFPL